MKITKSWALGLTVSMLALSAPAMAENVAPPQEAAPKSGPQLGTYGFDTEGMDTAVSPADDF